MVPSLSLPLYTLHISDDLMGIGMTEEVSSPAELNPFASQNEEQWAPEWGARGMLIVLLCAAMKGLGIDP